MTELPEGVQDGAPHPPGGRVVRRQIGKLLLQLLQLTHEPVVLRIRNRRIVENVVAVSVLVQLLGQLGDPLGGLLGRHPVSFRVAPGEYSRENTPGESGSATPRLAFG